MQTLHESRWITVAYDPTHQMLVATWKSECWAMPESAFKDINLLYISCFEQHPVKSFLIDTREFAFAITPELQEWVAGFIIPKVVGLGLRRLAFLVSKEMVAQLSIEQTMEESAVDTFQNRFFDTLEQARAWCIA